MSTVENKMRRSHGGYDFDFDSDRWPLKKGKSLSTRELRNTLGATISHGCISTLAHYAERTASATASQHEARFRHFVSFAAIGGSLKEITSANLISYRSSAFQTFGDDRAVILLRPFLLTWKKLSHPGISMEVVDLLESWKLKKPMVGDAVKRLDPDEGPLEPAELAELKNSVMAAYERGEITHHKFTFFLLAAFTGRRSIQLAALKLQDLDDTCYEDALTGIAETKRPLFLIHVPRSKQRGASFRNSFKAVAVIQPIWAAVIRQRADIISRFETILVDFGITLGKNELAELHRELPLFPSWSSIKTTIEALINISTEYPQPGISLALHDLSKTDAWHQTATGMGLTIQENARLSGATNRSGGLLHVSPKRLRYTKGTDAARAGFGTFVIAELLDHSTTACVDIYTKILPEHAASINLAMATSMAGLARLFLGKVVDREADAFRGDDPAVSRVLFKGDGAATCGSETECGLQRLPRPCYTCQHFQPWLDGPHEAFLLELLRERQDRLTVLGNPVMVGIEDHTIIAVINVIQRCEVRRGELAAAAESDIRSRTTSTRTKLRPTHQMRKLL
ncbi:site-specific integrase [Rugamonas apoptosis]|uniref:Phage integrase family protein n=1 Tax=Rugamonas apoptosis TaxID=2758570 RepID=A0A7W2FCR6_9BURK|nr:site-specific integrase [Rugamonas apoptosis]MBA5689169.1 hypothetical protein [Rugamonas apoptosis]